MAGEPVDFSELKVERLGEGHRTELFDCGVSDLNEFLQEDALNYQNQWLAVTYLCLYKDQPVGYYSLLNDSIELSEKEKSLFERLGKRLRSYPAIKIGRLAVDKKYQKQGVGEFLLGDVFIKALGTGKVSACRFITVDAYAERKDYYAKRCFVENETYTVSHRETASLRLDLYHWHERAPQNYSR